MSRYSAQFRNSVLKKMMPPENRTASEVAAEYNISMATIYNWKSKMKNGTLLTEDGAQSNRQRQPTEKFSLLLESKSVSESDFGGWLRNNGLHSQHLKVWEQELRETMTNGEKKARDELKAVKKQLKEQQKELQRKEKALAELAAIVTLQKKTELFLEEKEDD